MNRIQAKQMGEDIKNALKEVAEKYNMTIEYRGGTFSDTDYKPKITFTGKSTDGKSRQEQEWDLYADMLDLKKEWLGEVITLSGKDCIITGLDMKKSKYPVMVEGENGHKYKVTPQTLQLHLGSRT